MEQCKDNVLIITPRCNTWAAYCSALIVILSYDNRLLIDYKKMSVSQQKNRSLSFRQLLKKPSFWLYCEYHNSLIVLKQPIVGVLEHDVHNVPNSTRLIITTELQGSFTPVAFMIIIKLQIWMHNLCSIWISREYLFLMWASCKHEDSQ
jgi:hypothetical protein